MKYKYFSVRADPVSTGLSIPWLQPAAGVAGRLIHNQSLITFISK